MAITGTMAGGTTDITGIIMDGVIMAIMDGGIMDTDIMEDGITTAITAMDATTIRSTTETIAVVQWSLWNRRRCMLGLHQSPWGNQFSSPCTPSLHQSTSNLHLRLCHLRLNT